MLENYDEYFVDSENVMTLEDITMYAHNKDSAYMLIKNRIVMAKIHFV